MKKFLSVLLVLTVAMATASSAAAQTFHSLDQVQHYLYYHSPVDSIGDDPYVELEGTVSEIIYTGPNNHHSMTLLIDEKKASAPIWADSPQLTVHFRLHVDEVPWKVGDTVTVFGTLNHLYSSFMIPYIVASYINGSDDF